MGFALVYIFLLALFIFSPLAYRIYTESSSPELQEAANAFLALHDHFWPAIFVLLAIVGFHSIRFSHRMVGPVYRFKQTLKGIRKNDLSKNVTLRNGDFFVDLMDEFNHTILYLRESLTDMKGKNEELRRAIEGLNEKLDRGALSPEELKKSVVRIGKGEEALRHALDDFQLSK